HLRERCLALTAQRGFAAELAEHQCGSRLTRQVVTLVVGVAGEGIQLIAIASVRADRVRNVSLGEPAGTPHGLSRERLLGAVHARKPFEAFGVEEARRRDAAESIESALTVASQRRTHATR